MNIVSYVEDGKDVFSLLLEALQREKVSDKQNNSLLKKIYKYFKLFLMHQHPDGSRIKCVTGSIYELRIIIGGTSYLGRIFFHREKDKIILLTSCLVKPRQYDDKKTINHIDIQYQNCIKKSNEIVYDYKTSPKYSYAFISLPLF